ncbi:DUF2714 domain-containing protein [Mycoplasma sp. T363T]|uniref:DUF2714 domain-containing protein n=1 Tax=Mycoplasma bradburyae TaxID=2963128 RepID=A0AAW6HRF0_9MOLU|nr:DUF2714 domain-containing protein [Mycoplasma bradburyae]MDC4163180.1 DUF2714 domain-containing protein [Mycoplasma bradburyae]MDC4181794.1 DUF2714 domain-containing protein [Mycoplasma bradburyae]MDC4182495.1 DUF2714 domain-containing protein [Mycoplasma bradburyae]MDC4183168.1 DUF2714 domain-containing protein [Mycoplasma bradburyae]UTS70094.1 DUF2714 domain-containing protein [Mycoplasma bradburyae]
MKNKNKKTDQIQEDLVQTNYPSLVQHKDFVEFSQLFNTSLLQTNTSENSVQAKTFIEKIKDAITNRWEIVFDDLIISWTRNARFSWSKLVPIVTTAESSQSDAVNLRSTLENDEELRILVERFNLLLNNQLFDENKIVEVVDGIIIYRSPETNQLKVVFSQGIINA